MLVSKMSLEQCKLELENEYGNKSAIIDDFNEDDFWLSYSKIKTVKSCKRKFFNKYVLKLPIGEKPEIAKVGTLNHESFSGIYIGGIKDRWYGMSKDEIAEDMYVWHKNFILNKIKSNPEDYEGLEWGILFETNIRNISNFVAGIFIKFKKVMTKEQMKYYFLPVISEEFMRNANMKFNYVADAIFRIYETGDPKKDENLMIFDLKAGSAQPDKMRPDDKSQIMVYSIVLNDVNDNPEETRKAEDKLKRRVELLERVSILEVTPENSKNLKSTKFRYEDVVKSNNFLRNIGGRITKCAILYGANGRFFMEDIKKVSITYANKKINGVRTDLELHDWTDSWGTRSCLNEYYDKVTREMKEIRCDFYDICEKEND